jgi:hypothetical protein
MSNQRINNFVAKGLKAIAYLHAARSQVDIYLKRLKENREQRYQEFNSNPPAIVEKLRIEKAKRAATRI